MSTRVALHRFESDPALPQRDGVNLAHIEINALLASPLAGRVEAQFHDFDALMRSDAHALEVLKDADCVLCNVGPHAHYYHYLREKLGLGFRIVRDIRTALWSCYLLQEALCQPYLRPGDALIALSGYSRALTRHLFPHLRDHAVPLFDPVLATARRTPPLPRRAHEGTITLGHVGRLSKDKNFPQMVDLLVSLDRQEPGRYRLVACGAAHSPGCDPAVVAEHVRERTGRSGLFTYIPPLPHDEAVGLYGTFDYFLFFSTSTVETLGRVLLEANHSNVPVLAANHAACAEMLDASSLVDVEYSREPFYSHFDAPMGRVDIEAVARSIRRGFVPDAPPPPRVNDVQVLLDVLHGRPAGGETDVLDDGPRQFLERLRWSDLPRYTTRSQADLVVAELREWFCALNEKKCPSFEARLARLERLSRFPERTARFIEAAGRTRCDFTNLGGLDMELCNVAAFHPQFRLD